MVVHILYTVRTLLCMRLFFKYSKELYSKVLQEETGMDTGYLPVGFIELACDTDRLQYYRRVASFNRFCGVQVEELTPSQVRENFPLLAIEESNVLAGFYVPTDGRVNPYDATMALAKGARLYGATILEDTPITGITKSRTVSDESDILAALPRVTGVTLDSGETIEANVVVNCAGMWARQFGAKCGVDSIPNQAAEHYYLLTDSMPEVDPMWPVVEDSSRCTYIRPEGGGLMLGFFEWEGAAWNARNDIPHDFSFGEIEPDWERMGPYVEKAMELAPSTMNVGIKTLFCGPESFTPDNNPIVGEAPELRNYYVAAGLNSVGILTGGGTCNVILITAPVLWMIIDSPTDAYFLIVFYMIQWKGLETFWPDGFEMGALQMTLM
jgi:glycine/D-amino acid oxidase-like deaminating enzyme